MQSKMNIHNHNSFLEIDLATLRRNARTILDSLGEGTQLIPVLKDDAYGLGAVPIARELCRLPEIRLLAVAHVSEGLALREAGIDREILVMGGALPFQTEAAVKAGLTLACGRPGFARELAAAARACGRRAKLQLKIDTGLHRIGIEPGEVSAWIEEYRAAGEALELTGVFSHFSDAENLALDEEEFALFLRTLGELEAAGIEIPLRHIACSAASERFPQFQMDGVRCGRRLYMDRTQGGRGDIRELASFRSFITQLRDRRAGETLGYGAAVRLDRDTQVATVGVGYGDGLNQELFRIGGPVLVGGKRCRMLACCMDQCMIDVSGVGCAVGDEVTFFGYDAEGSFLSSQEVAALVGGDEGCGLTSALSPRVARVYKEME